MSEILDNKSKKTFVWLIIVGVIAFGYLTFSVGKNFKLGQKDSPIAQLFKQESELANQDQGELKDSNQISEVSPSVKQVYVFTTGEAGQNPFNLLVDQETVEYDEYEAGVFVTSINGQESNSNFYWALYVNDGYAQVAANKIELEIGDVVEWRWEAIVQDFVNKED